MHFIVDKNDVSYSNKAISLPVRRKGSRGVVEYCWFPKSQLVISESAFDVVITMPEWLFNKNVGEGFTIC